VEQAGSPHEVYEHPANPFVMRFLGPVTRIGDSLVRPHDVELAVAPQPGSAPATVTRVVRLGFEVRVELAVAGQDAWVQVTRGTAQRLNLGAGDTVHVRPSAEAKPLAVGAGSRTRAGNVSGT
jgi:sulfate/thiosulfate transport system ATP-binding protein